MSLPAATARRSFAKRCACSWMNFPDDTEADGAAAIVVREAVAVARSQVVRRREPRAAAHLAGCTIAVETRGAVARCATVRIAPAVLHPLEHVADHVVQAEGIRRESADRRALHVAVVAGEH